MPRKYDKQVFNPKQYQMELINDEQKAAYEAYKENDILFLLGPAGSGKTFLAMNFAIHDILKKERSRIVLSRPVVEAGENLGFLPGEVDEKIYPYMLPLYDCLDKICGKDSEARKRIDDAYELAPLAFLRGRAQPLESTIMTPNGPKIMGEMIIGSEVIGADGMPHKVIGVYPQGKKEVYKVSFSDGTWTECCDEHLWSTQTLSEKRHNKDFSVKQISEIKKNIINKYGQKNHKIPTCKIVNFDKKEISLDPYLLGLLLGDGCLHKSAGISFSTKDTELLDKMSNIIPPEIKIVYKGQYDWRLTTGNRQKKNPIKTALREMELLGSKSNNKFIPNNYKFNDYQTRLSILQGLMDTDGTIYMDSKNTRIQFNSTSEILAKDVVFLVQSLGGIAYLRKREYDEKDFHFLRDKIIKHVNSCWIVEIVMEINPFRLTRKSEKFVGRKPTKLISNIELIGEKECQCIQIDSKDHLYLTDNFIVTHNTMDGAVCILDEAQNCTKAQLKMFLTRLGKFSKMIITGDHSQTDLPNGTSGLMEVVQKCKPIKGIGYIHFSEEAIVRHPLVAQIVKRI